MSKKKKISKKKKDIQSLRIQQQQARRQQLKQYKTLPQSNSSDSDSESEPEPEPEPRVSKEVKELGAFNSKGNNRDPLQSGRRVSS